MNSRANDAARATTSLSLNGRVIVLTGAASGIGAALASGLAAEGADLALVDCNGPGLDAVAEAARRSGGRVCRYTVDLGDRAAIGELPGKVSADLGSASVLINNAGMALAGTFEQVPAAQFDRLFAVNFLSVVAMTRSFLPQLRQHRPAQIMNMSSVFGIIGAAGQVAYSASKFAVRGFSESLRAELADADIGVTVIHPGGVRTNIALSALLNAGLNEEQIAVARGPAEAPLRMKPQDAASRIIGGLKRRKNRILVGEDAKLVARTQRLYPVNYGRILSAMENLSRERPSAGSNHASGPGG